MSTIEADGLFDDEQISLTESGPVAIRSFILGDIPGDKISRMWNAATDPNVPIYGEPHPVVPGIRVTNVQIGAMDRARAKVTVTYSRPTEGEDVAFVVGSATGEKGTISVSTAGVTEQTNFDVDDNPIIVSYTGTLVDSEGNQVEVQNDEQIATLEVVRPQTVIGFSRREDSSPLGLTRDMVGTVNDSRIGFYARNTLLLVRVDANSDDGGDTFNVQYEFQYSPDGWNSTTVAYIDPETARPPVDVEIGNGLVEVASYPESRFDVLRLPF